MPAPHQLPRSGRPYPAASATTFDAELSVAPAALAGIPEGSTTELAQGLSAEENLADLQLIADSLTALAGFGAASIRIACADGLHLAVVSGSDEARRSLSGSPIPVSVLEEDLARADDWGLFKFVPAERLDRSGDTRVAGWVPDLTPGDGADAWQPLDLLIAPLRDANGTLRGTLSVDLPADGKRPDAERRAVLTRHAAQAERAIVLAVQREQLARHVRLAETARDVIRRAAREVEPARVLASVGGGLVDVFGLAALWLHVGRPEGGVRTWVFHQAAGRPLTEGAHLYTVYEEHARQLWRTQQVALASVDGTLRNVGGSEADRRALLEHMAEYGLGAVATVPLGAGEEWYGALILGRTPDAPAWTDLELGTLRDLGRDLGRVVDASRTYRRQREVVQSLQELAGHKSRLIATLAHELKNPLTAIRWNIDTLPLMSSDEEYADLLAVVERNRDRTRQIVADLGVLSAVTDPDQLPAAVPVLIAPVVVEARELVTSLRDTSTQIVLELPEEPVSAYLARGELHRIVLNLLTNAVKYSPDGGTVTVALDATADEVILSVADHGIGIAEVDRERLFGEFFRSTNPVALRQPGTGLGLAIVDRIVRGRGGRIEVDSQLGVGSTFRVVLPRASRP